MSRGRNDSATSVQNRFFGFADQVEDFPEFVVGGLGSIELVAVDVIDFSGEKRFEDLQLSVFGNVDHHGTGAPRFSQIKCFLDDAGQVFGGQHQVAVLDDGESHSEKVGFLKSALSDELLVNLAGDGDERNAVHVCVGYAGDQIGGPGTRCRHAHAGFAGCPGITVGHEPAALFLTGQDGSDLFGLGQGLVQFHGCSARVGEHHLHALALKGVDDASAPFMAGPSSPFASGSGWVMDCGFMMIYGLNHSKCQKTCCFSRGKEKTEAWSILVLVGRLFRSCLFSLPTDSLSSPSDPEDIEN